ncbi:MAG: FAD-binding protein [Chloroflexi bacterium]|nr:FAD-binding protein [Chloroflexota bacterium]
MTNANEFKTRVTGRVLTPADADYEQARLPWNRAYSPHPALILIAENAQDVIEGVKFAHENNLGVAVQTTGHGPQRLSDDNLLIVMSKLTSVQVDAETRRARIAGGAVWKHVLEQVTPLGLAPLLGSSPHVGVVGYTLGGGIGLLARKYGLAADSVRGIDVVTADGVLRHASASENSDLFWAMRGAGGNFGVVTALEIELYPVATVYGGFLVYPGELATEALRFFREWTKNAPDGLTSSFSIGNFPDLPFLPEVIRGKTQLFLRAAYAGDPDEGAAQIQKWIDWHAPLQNSFRRMPFSEVATIYNDPVDPAAAHGSNMMFDALSDEAIDVIVRHATDKSSPLVLNELRHAGGAIARVPAESSAINNRDAQYYFNIGGPFLGRDVKDAIVAAIREYRADLQPYLRSGIYMNFNSVGEVDGRVKEAFAPETLERLQAIKAEYDPENMFRFAYPLRERVAEKASIVG